MSPIPPFCPRLARPPRSLLALGLVLASACTGPKAPLAPRKEAPASVHVDAQPAQARQVPLLVPILGALTSSRRTQLAANASGRVTAVLVERGARVEAGQVLLTLDVRSAAHAAKEAQANLQNLHAAQQVARGDCARYEALHRKQAITQQEYERTMAQCREADAQLEAAQARASEAMRTLQDGSVRAPFAGVISERSVDVGDYVRQDSPVATLLVPDPLRLQCGVPEAYAQVAKVGTPIYFEVAAYPDREFCGTIEFVSGEVRTQTRDIVVEAEVKNGSGELLAGMFATAFLKTGERALPVVPPSALLDVGEEKLAYVVHDGVLQARVVRTGRKVDGNVAIESGLVAGEQVVVVATRELADGTKVQ